MEALAHIINDPDRQDYAALLREDEKDHVCPLCPNGLKRVNNQVLKSQGGWKVLLNHFAYEHTKVHVLILPDEHKTSFAQLTAEDWDHVRLLAEWTIEHFHIKGGALTVRFGEFASSGASVRHIHFHIIEPEHNPETDQNYVVDFSIGSDR